MAAAAHTNGAVAAALFVTCAGVFAFLSFKLGGRIKGRIAHTPA